MKKLLRDQPTEGDLALREVWRAKDALSTARGHSTDFRVAESRVQGKNLHLSGQGERVVTGDVLV